MGTFEIEEVGRPDSDDEEEWEKFWISKNQPWRTEPEISKERQEYLAERRKIKPDTERRIYPFKAIKLSRADIEWLLSTHENGRGPVDWNDQSQRERVGLDLRGADLHGENLERLPLARIISGPRGYTVLGRRVQVGGATIYLEGPRWQGTPRRVQAIHGVLPIHIESTTIHLEGAILKNAHLEGADLGDANLEGARLDYANLEGAFLSNAHLEGAKLQEAHLERVGLRNAHLEGAFLSNAHLEGAKLQEAHLERVGLRNAHLEGAILSNAHLEGAYLFNAFFDSATNLEQIVLNTNENDTASLCDIHWGDVNVAVIDWSTISRLGDENRIGNTRRGVVDYEGDCERAARAYRQLSVVLRNHGLNDHAARFAYRAQIMQRKVFWYQRKHLQYLGSYCLDLLSGYGYKVGRCFIAYVLVIGIFATIYHFLGTHPPLNEAIVISMTAFHGRGFFPEQFHPGDPQALAAAIEALVGLLIEITLIVTLTQRFFGK